MTWKQCIPGTTFWGPTSLVAGITQEDPAELNVVSRCIQPVINMPVDLRMGLHSYFRHRVLATNVPPVLRASYYEC